MSRIKVTAAGHVFVAETHPDAPETVAAFLKLLPYTQKLIHVRWSGEGVWMPLGDLDFGVSYENHTSYPAPDRRGQGEPACAGHQGALGRRAGHPVRGKLSPVRAAGRSRRRVTRRKAPRFCGQA